MQIIEEILLPWKFFIEQDFFQVTGAKLVRICKSNANFMEIKSPDIKRGLNKKKLYYLF